MITAIRSIVRVLLLYSAIAFPTGVSAEALDGNRLYSACTSESPAEKIFCVGYIIGALEGLKYGAFIAVSAYEAAHEDERTTPEFVDIMADLYLGYCIPGNANNEQVSDVVISYLRDNPSDRHNTARALITEAFVKAFPC